MMHFSNRKLSIIPENHISYEAQDRVKKILEPLRKKLGIHYFDMGVTFSDGTGFTLHTNHHFYETWFTEQFPLSAFSLPSNWYTWGSCCVSPMLKVAESLGIDSGILHVSQEKDKTIIVAFATEVGYENSISMYMNNLCLLKRFKQYFIESAKDLLIKANRQRILYQPILTKKNEMIESIGSISSDFINELYYPFNLLSKRERDCFSLLIKGYSNQAMSELLQIAQTTVNVYIARIKHKLNCSNKREMITKAHELGLIDYFMV
jgi:DNA-binding CsgD family transcriptional regulator